MRVDRWFRCFRVSMHSMNFSAKPQVVWMVMALSACATPAVEFDDSFDPAWMTVIPVERAALQSFCVREDRQNLMGCARPYYDHPWEGSSADRLADATGRGTCVIYVARDLIKDSATFDYVLRHEAKHCRGWRHAGD